MAHLIIFSPGGTGPGAIAKLVWAGSQAVLEAARGGQSEAAQRLGVWLLNTRADPRCTPPLARVIDRALEAARQRLAPAAELAAADVIPLRRWRFEPVQPDDGEVA